MADWKPMWDRYQKELATHGGILKGPHVAAHEALVDGILEIVVEDMMPKMTDAEVAEMIADGDRRLLAALERVDDE